jgi:uncharacterized membrane protein YkoI
MGDVKRHSVVVVAAFAGLVLAGCANEKENEAAGAAEPAVSAVQPGAQSYAVVAPDSLRALATISLDSAAKLASARVPEGAIAKVELEREDGALIWSFDLMVAGQEGVSEVAVNAVTGAVVAVEHEGAAAEAREAREDSATASKAPRRP